MQTNAESHVRQLFVLLSESKCPDERQKTDILHSVRASVVWLPTLQLASSIHTPAAADSFVILAGLGWIVRTPISDVRKGEADVLVQWLPYFRFAALLGLGLVTGLMTSHSALKTLSCTPWCLCTASLLRSSNREDVAVSESGR